MHYCFADARINSYTNSSTSCKKVVKIGPAFFLPRDAMLSVVYAVVVCLSVCLSVCEIISASEVEGIVQRAVESAVKEVNEVQQLLQDRFDELQNKLMVLENRVLALRNRKLMLGHHQKGDWRLTRSAYSRTQCCAHLNSRVSLAVKRQWAI